MKHYVILFLESNIARDSHYTFHYIKEYPVEIRAELFFDLHESEYTYRQMVNYLESEKVGFKSIIAMADYIRSDYIRSDMEHNEMSAKAMEVVKTISYSLEEIFLSETGLITALFYNQAGLPIKKSNLTLSGERISPDIQNTKKS